MNNKSQKSKKPALSIRLRIFLSMLILVSVMQFILWISQTIFLTQIYQYVKLNEMEKATYTIKKNIGQENFEAILDSLSEDYKICMTVINTTQGAEVVYKSHTLNDCIIHEMSAFDIKAKWYNEAMLNDGEITKIISNDQITGAAHNVNFDNEFSENCIVCATTYESDDGNIYMFTLNSSVLPVTATIRTMRTQLMSISILMVAVACIISFVITFAK